MTVTPQAQSAGQPPDVRLDRSAPPPGLLLVSEAATVLRLSRKAVYELIASGALGYVQIGRRKRVPLDELRRFIAERAVPPSLRIRRNGTKGPSRRTRPL